jgi:hypothetical protein
MKTYALVMGAEENIWTEEGKSDRRLEKKSILKIFITCTLRRVKEEEMGKEHSTHGGEWI